MLRGFGQCAPPEVVKIETREARFDPRAAGQFPQKNTGLRRTPSKPFCDAPLNRIEQRASSKRAKRAAFTTESQYRLLDLQPRSAEKHSMDLSLIHI